MAFASTCDVRCAMCDVRCEMWDVGGGRWDVGCESVNARSRRRVVELELGSQVSVSRSSGTRGGGCSSA